MQLPSVAFAATILTHWSSFIQTPKKKGHIEKELWGIFGLLTWVLLVDKHRIESKLSAVCIHACEVYFQY